MIARYVFNPGRGELYYAELPLDPYHSESLRANSCRLTPGASKSWPHFYVTEVAEFSLSYVGKERETLDAAMDGTSGLPTAVMVKCTAKGSSETITTLMFLNSPFAKSRQETIGAKANLPGSQFPGQRKTR